MNITLLAALDPLAYLAPLTKNPQKQRMHI
jgi:hypothetical protein